MPGAEIDDPSTTEASADTPRDLPRLEQLFSRQAARAAHDAGDSMEEGVAGEAAEIVIRETGFRRRGEHASSALPLERGHFVRFTSLGLRPSPLDTGASAGASSSSSLARPAAAAFEWWAFRRPSLKARLWSSLNVRRGLSFVGRTTPGVTSGRVAACPAGAAGPASLTPLKAASALSTASS